MFSSSQKPADQLGSKCQPGVNACHWMDKTRLLPQIQTLPLVVDVCSSLPRGSNVICQFWIAFGNGRISLKNICMYDGGNTLCFFSHLQHDSMSLPQFLHAPYLLCQKKPIYARRAISSNVFSVIKMNATGSSWTFQDIFASLTLQNE